MSIPEVVRELIVAAKKRGEKEAEIALWMGVSKPSQRSVRFGSGIKTGVIPSSSKTQADQQR